MCAFAYTWDIAPSAQCFSLYVAEVVRRYLAGMTLVDNTGCTVVSFCSLPLHLNLGNERRINILNCCEEAAISGTVHEARVCHLNIA